MGDSRPTVVFLNHWAANPGGAEHSLCDIIAESRDRFRCTLVTAEEGWLVDKVRALGVAVWIVPGGLGVEGIRRDHLISSILVNSAGFASFVLFVLRLRKLLKDLAPDLVHANIPKSHIALFLLVRLGYDRACVFHVREIFRPQSLPFRLYRRLFPRNGHVIAISQAVKDALPTGMSRRCIAIRNGILIPPEPIRVGHGGKKRLRLLYLGRIVQWKGCHYLLDVFEALSLSHPDLDIRLTLAGGSFYGGDAYRAGLVRRIAGMEHAAGITLLEHMEAPQSLYLSNDVFCNASYMEPFGRVLAEAAASGMPVVSFDSGGVGEIVENGVNGFLVPYGDIDAFVAALARFITEPELLGCMGSRGRHKASLEFNAAVQMPRIVEHLADCILD